MANILDGIGPEGSILDGLDDWPRSATRKEWLRITRGLVASTIAQMALPAHELAQVEDVFHRSWHAVTSVARLHADFDCLKLT